MLSIWWSPGREKNMFLYWWDSCREGLQNSNLCLGNHGAMWFDVNLPCNQRPGNKLPITLVLWLYSILCLTILLDIWSHPTLVAKRIKIKKFLRFFLLSLFTKFYHNSRSLACCQIALKLVVYSFDCLGDPNLNIVVVLLRCIW
jgi:hypothetical protein